MIEEVPLLHYNPTTQNQRVRSFGTADKNEDTPYIYRLEDYIFPTSLEPLIRAAYYQVFSEHETLKFNRQKSLESQIQNRVITVKDFIRGLAKSERFYELVVSTNNNYRLVEVCLKRLLGRAPYNQDEKIAWSVKTSTLGFHGFVDAIIDSEEYKEAFGNNIVPYQRKRMEGRPFNLVTPRYGREHYERELAVTGEPDWRFIMAKFYHRKHHERQMREGDPRKYRDMLPKVAPNGPNPNEERVSTIKVGPFDVDYFLRKWLV
ncbi:MAG: phycobilisome rod-core linker polypeptide [Chroococcidiopsidaceae cyanobacterium CP_BM_RX_35]|nr:phycobilisome rod-core linker polypeptide [Chroococcidiopsidaceae cyanobacterium CP_BM_RX_35]